MPKNSLPRPKTQLVKSVIGQSHVDAINGQGGEEIPEFVPTRHELISLAQYWALERIDHDFYWFVYQGTGSREWRWSVYIDRRLDRLGAILGDNAMQEVHEHAAAAFRKKRLVTEEDWRIFTQGSEEEQQAWREKVLREEEEMAEKGSIHDAAPRGHGS